MSVTWKIYGIFHPGTHDLLYVGQTKRAIHERKEEHLLDIKDTLISKKIRQIKETTGSYPDFGILQDGIKDKRMAHYRELYHIYKHLSEGARLLNREGRDWFLEGYDKAFSPSSSSPKRKSSRTAKRKKTASIPPLKPETYTEAQAKAPGADIKDLEQRWRGWLSTPGKTLPNYPDRHFIAFCEKASSQ